MNRKRNIYSAVVIALLMLCVCGCSAKRTYQAICDVNHLEGRRIGVNMAWSADYLLSGRDDVKLLRYNTSSDLVMALRFGQIDAASMEKPFAVEMMSHVSGLSISDQVVATAGFVFAVNNDRADILDELNEFFTKYEGSPEQEELFERLNTTGEFDYHKVEETGGDKVLTVGLPTDSFPISYIDFETGEYAGSDVEVITRFANEYGYRLEFTPGTFTTIEMDIAAGEYDVAIGSFCDVARTDSELGGAFQMTRSYMPCEVVLIEATDPDNIKVLTPVD